MLDKNPQQNQIKNYSDLSEVLAEYQLNVITYTEPYSKAIFLKQILPEIKTPIIFLDFDLLFSGYLTLQSFSKSDNLILFQPEKQNWPNILKEILSKLSDKQSFLIIDSLNNFLNMFEANSNTGRLVNSYIMLLTSIAKMSKSSICILSMTRNNTENLILSISGRRIPEIKNMTHIHFYQTNSNLKITRIEQNESNSFVLPIRSELV